MMSPHEIMMGAQLPRAKANCMLSTLLHQSNDQELHHVEGGQGSVTASSLELSQVRWLSYPDALGINTL